MKGNTCINKKSNSVFLINPLYTNKRNHGKQYEFYSVSYDRKSEYELEFIRMEQ